MPISPGHIWEDGETLLISRSVTIPMRKLLSSTTGRWRKLIFGHYFPCLRNISVYVNGDGISGHYFADKHFILQWLKISVTRVVMISCSYSCSTIKLYFQNLHNRTLNLVCRLNRTSSGRRLRQYPPQARKSAFRLSTVRPARRSFALSLNILVLRDEYLTYRRQHGHQSLRYQDHFRTECAQNRHKISFHKTHGILHPPDPATPDNSGSFRSPHHCRFQKRVRFPEKRMSGADEWNNKIP